MDTSVFPYSLSEIIKAWAPKRKREFCSNLSTAFGFYHQSQRLTGNFTDKALCPDSQNWILLNGGQSLDEDIFGRITYKKNVEFSKEDTRKLYQRVSHENQYVLIIFVEQTYIRKKYWGILERVNN